MLTPKVASALVVGLALVPGLARAQAPQPTVPESTISDRREVSNGQKDWHFVGHVEIERGTDTKIFADDVRFESDTNHAVATGHVVISQGNNRIAAERAEFDTETRLGTFYQASGVAFVQPPRQAPRPGVAGIQVPQVPGQENVVYFFGDVVEKVGPKKYRITNGGFTTCVQPTPRWNLSANTVVLNVDHYTFLRDAVLTVKGVPMLYLPVLYYPTKREDRATGFLIPTYGSSTLRGQSIHNAFFWAIDRSQDATFAYDWFSKTGQGLGSEYRYNFGGGSDGNIRMYLLDEHEAVYTLADGTSSTIPARKEYTIVGGANAILPGNFRARTNVNYFSSIVMNQTFNTNVANTINNQRSFGGNVIGTVGGFSLNGTFARSENFYSATDSVVSGRLPQVTLSRNERPLLGSPIYFSATAESAGLLGENRSVDSDNKPVDISKSLWRFDVQPQIRYPFKKWQWFTVNSVVNVRDTLYTRSYDAKVLTDPSNTTVVDETLNRQYFTLQTQILGPVFNRIWDTPANGYAEKFKHSVEPYLNVQRTSSVDNYQRIVVFDGTDTIVGGVQYQYGLNNRFYAKRRGALPGQPSLSREIFDVELTQTYYTNQTAAQFDARYQSSFNTQAPSNFSPISLNVRAMPTNDVSATMRAEFDARYHALRTISANGTFAWTNRVQTTAGWSKQAFIEELQGFNDKTQLNQSLNASTNVHTQDNRFGTIYSFNYDILRGYFVQQRVSAFYNAQCCGLAMEYQAYNFGSSSLAAIPADHRFFLSFTLAGLGNFSPFNGALNGVPR